MTRNKNTFINAISIIAGSIAPCVGILFFGWGIFPILILYWTENIVIAFYAANKIMISPNTFNFHIQVSKSSDSPFVGKKGVEKVSKAISLFNKTSRDNKIFSVKYFIIDFFIISAFLFYMLFHYFDFSDFTLHEFIIGAVSLFISHGLTYYFVYIKKDEYKKVSIDEIIHQTEKRITILSLTIFIGGVIYIFLFSDIAILIVMLVVKIFVDLILFRQEHKKLQIIDKVIEVKN